MTRGISAIVLAATVAACSSACVPAPTAITSQTIPTATTTALAAGPWTEIELPNALGLWRASGVIADADGFVIYGIVSNRPAAWTSSDGAAWTAVALPGVEGFPSRAASSSQATVLIGIGSTSRCAHPSGEFLWRRVTGEEEWQLVPFDQDLFCAGGFPAIAARKDLFLVAGMGTGDQPFAWRSADGLSWQDAGAGLPNDLPPWALAATPDLFLELGRGDRTDARTTADGSKWTKVDAPPAPPAFSDNPPGMDPAALIDTGRGLLAVYAGDATRTAAWLRGDDGSWAEVQLPSQAGDAIGGGVSVEGRAYLFASRQRTAGLLTSTDMTTWNEIPVPRVTYVLGLASFGGRTVVVTSLPDTNGETDRSIVFVMNGVPGGN